MLPSQTNVHDVALCRHFERRRLRRLTNVPQFDLGEMRVSRVDGHAHRSTRTTYAVRSVVRRDDVRFKVLVEELRTRQNDVNAGADIGLNQLQENDERRRLSRVDRPCAQLVEFVTRRTRLRTERGEKSSRRRVVVETRQIL
jgi:hypothetical protein